jgi:hypothetical protein
VTLALSTQATFALGAFLDDARSTPATRYDGLFGYLSDTFDVAKVFSKPP